MRFGKDNAGKDNEGGLYTVLTLRPLYPNCSLHVYIIQLYYSSHPLSGTPLSGTTLLKWNTFLRIVFYP